jgi:hypothetical protein
MALNQRFRGIECFQWVEPDFVSPFSCTASFRQNKSPAQRGAAHSPGKAGIPATVAEDSEIGNQFLSFRFMDWLIGAKSV